VVRVTIINIPPIPPIPSVFTDTLAGQHTKWFVRLVEHGMKLVSQWTDWVYREAIQHGFKHGWEEGFKEGYRRGHEDGLRAERFRQKTCGDVVLLRDNINGDKS